MQAKLVASGGCLVRCCLSIAVPLEHACTMSYQQLDDSQLTGDGSPMQRCGLPEMGASVDVSTMSKKEVADLEITLPCHVVLQHRLCEIWARIGREGRNRATSQSSVSSIPMQCSHPGLLR